MTIVQIERLYARFTSLDKQNHGYLTREDFLRYDLVLEIKPKIVEKINISVHESKLLVNK